MQRGLLVVISGPSGAGKGTLCKALLQKSKNIKLSVSCTTRSPRDGEIDGINYFFLEKEDFIQKINSSSFLEYAKVYDNYYGTPKEYVEENLNNGIDVILEIDVQGALKVKENYNEGLFIFIMPPSMQELRERIIKRGSETEDSLKKRFDSAFKEIEYVSEYDYVVENDIIDTAVEKLQCIITAEKCKTNRQKERIEFIKEGYKNE